MKPKTIITSILLAFVFVSAGYMIIKESKSSVITEANTQEQAVVSGADSEAPATAVPQENQTPVALPSASSQPVKRAEAKNENPAQQPESRKLIVYYFHGNFRCPSCRKIEAYAKESVETNFKDKIDGGVIEWRLVNIDEPENKHFVQDYQLITRSVVVSEIINGRQVSWKNLDKVWDLLGNKDAFLAYIRDEVTQILTRKS